MAYVLIIMLFWLLAVLTSMEMATFSARKERMVQAAEAGDRRGIMVNAYQRAPADYLSAIQLVATAASFVIGAMIGSNVEAPVRMQFEEWFPTFLYRPQLSWIVSVGVMTILALIFTNVFPKHIGFVRANEIALKSAPLMRFWIKATWPITLLVRRTTKLLARLLRIAPDERFRVTERDIDALLLEGVRAGSLDPTEQAMMRRALKLSDTRVGDAMVPRKSIRWIDPSWSDRRILEFFRHHEHSNFVVGKGGLDHVVGVVRAQDWLLDHDLGRVCTKPVHASPEDSLLTAVELLRPSDTRLLVVRESDRVVGVLTLNDVLAHIVGPIHPT